MRISGTDIYIAQGDSATLTLSFEESQTGLTMWIGSTKNTILAGIPTVENNLHHYPFEIESTHTNIVGSFNYDIFKIDNGKKTTVIRNSLFVVEPTAEGQSASQSSSQQSGSNPEE